MKILSFVCLLLLHCVVSRHSVLKVVDTWHDLSSDEVVVFAGFFVFVSPLCLIYFSR